MTQYWWLLPIVIVLAGLWYYRYDLSHSDSRIQGVFGAIVLLASVTMSIGIVIGYFLRSE